MHLFYVDDSHERHFYTFVALGIPAERWREVFYRIKAFREDLRDKHGIGLKKELHAWKFTSGRGRPSNRILPKQLCIEVYLDTLRFIASLSECGVILFGTTSRNEEWAFERLLNRINRTMEALNSHASLFCDEGNESGFTNISRRLAVFNFIPSKYGEWKETGAASKNIPTDRFVEDPVFKPSHKSYLIQFADFCAYALLQMERPDKPLSRAMLVNAYSLLEPVCYGAANLNDRFGIVRDRK